MRIRRAATLVCTFEGAKPVVHNFLKKEMFECNARALDILARLDDWQTMEDALAHFPGPIESNAELLKELISRDLVLLEDSPQAERDLEYRDDWRWGAVAGFYQFSQRDQKFLDGEQIEDRMILYQAESPSPPVVATNESLETRIALPVFDTADPFFEQLHARQSCREYSGAPISLEALADCLFAANGVKDIRDYGPFGALPRTMTPSGGARNPYELYVYVRAVSELETGFYHYSTLDHELGFLHAKELPQPVDLLGTQDWTNDAAAIVFMVATFERTAWKYRQPLAYRVVLMETGYIAQNLLLTATYRGIAAAPTGALAESRVESLLGVDGIRSAVIFAVVLGDPLQ